MDSKALLTEVQRSHQRNVFRTQDSDPVADCSFMEQLASTERRGTHSTRRAVRTLCSAGGMGRYGPYTGYGSSSSCSFGRSGSIVETQGNVATFEVRLQISHYNIAQVRIFVCGHE